MVKNHLTQDENRARDEADDGQWPRWTMGEQCEATTAAAAAAATLSNNQLSNNNKSGKHQANGQASSQGKQRATVNQSSVACLCPFSVRLLHSHLFDLILSLLTLLRRQQHEVFPSQSEKQCSLPWRSFSPLACSRPRRTNLFLCMIPQFNKYNADATLNQQTGSYTGNHNNGRVLANFPKMAHLLTNESTALVSEPVSSYNLVRETTPLASSGGGFIDDNNDDTAIFLSLQRQLQCHIQGQYCHTIQTKVVKHAFASIDRLSSRHGRPKSEQPVSSFCDATTRTEAEEYDDIVVDQVTLMLIHTCMNLQSGVLTMLL
jgi:hypothetical protein